MRNSMFKLNTVLLSMLAASGMTTVAQAQTNAADEAEVIHVKGIRSSLNKSAALKRDASGVIDAISAEDIGKFPDTNLAESLQRITGVSIDRSNNEGNQVTVRGFGPSFNLVTLNGRQMPNSSALDGEGISRSFNFKEVGADTVSAVEVYKTGKANVSSGGIGATINIKTAKPFDRPGFNAHASAKAVMDTSTSDGTGRTITPELSGTISNTFLDDTVGVMLSLSHAERDSHKDRVGTQNSWSRGYPGFAEGKTPDTSAIDTNKNPTLETWKVPTVDLDDSNTERTRQNAQLVFQYAISDNLTATADYTMSRHDEKTKMNRMSFWFDNLESGKADVNGTIIDPRRTNDELNFWAWEYAFETENDSYGLNFEWFASDNLKFELDIHDSTSHANPGALPAERLANLANIKTPDGQGVTIQADFSSNMPSVSYDDSVLTGGAYELSNMRADLYQERGYEIKNNIQQIQLHGNWENSGSGGLSAIDFGIATTNYKVDTTKIYSANFALGGDMDISSLDLSLKPGGIGFEKIPNYSAIQFIDMVKEQDLFVDTNTNLNGIEEETLAYYVSFDFETEFNGMDFNANIGVRYEDTDVSSYSIEKPVIGFNWVSALEMSKMYADEETSSTLYGDYNYFLPNMDFSLNITDDIITRMSYSTTISRSDISAMFPATELTTHLSTGPFKANQGNPNLLPYESRNFDLSLEWYYGDTSYMSAGYFRKQVDNFIATGEDERVIEGPNGALTNPSVNPRGNCPEGSPTNPVSACTSQNTDPAILWTVTTPKNLDSTEVRGWEFNIQHMFGDSGFGTIANYTLVDSSDNYDIYNLNNDFALTGLSDSANLVGFYEQDLFSLRVAYNWRDKFLLKGGNEPTFTEAYQQIDISASVELSDSLSLVIEGLNITDETTRRHNRFQNQIVDFEDYGARYNIGITAKF
ncbi:TonB-dependent receptor [Catenovulum agarivorans DS-2]|uniref:TonB-dependent receptor n=1 Tax=Catenovulum agarivorans DS-2 TaxID=1328313 RepID=W7QCL9_9ALTE|nr:TonB-dependent receptor [Catenovulum agarivorans]EWH09651.1 TonB-dependent receptor [Catenovulum agarivorans DS-2]